MIYDSQIWKLELKNKTKEFLDLIERTNFSSDWYFDEDEDGLTGNYKFFIEFQKYCFYSAVITRKFIESYRLSDEIISKIYQVRTFKKKTEKTLTKENFESIEEEYDTGKPTIEELSLAKICHLYIHSFAFAPDFNDYKIDEELPDEDIDNWEIEGISGLYINTDYSKDKKVHYFEMDQIFRIFMDVYNDDVVYYCQNRVTGETIRSCKHPETMKNQK